MDKLNLNNLLNRQDAEKTFIDTLNNYETYKHLLITKKGIYVYGSSGVGKSMFVKKILKKMGYDVILYDAGDVRNRTVIDNITKDNMANMNVLSMFKKEKRKLIIVMDEIDGMNSGDKGGINTLIKLIRPKKTNKQKKEDRTNIPVVCIGNYHVDKKIKEIIKVCTPIELEKPSKNNMKILIKVLMPKLKRNMIENVFHYVDGDLRKLNGLHKIYKTTPGLITEKLISEVFYPKNFNKNTKDTTKLLLNNKYDLQDHSLLINDTDRTSISLLFHENLIDVLKKEKKLALPFYSKVLSNICFADYIDRITFQKQIWIFNEMSSLIKTFYNNHLYQKNYGEKNIEFNPTDVRFTKVLTKYSTEYNNSIFIQNLCKQLNMDIKDMFSLWIDLKNKYTTEEIVELFDNENYEINKLDINRIYRFLNVLL